MSEVHESARHRAVEAAYAAHADDVYRLAYALLHDREDATDAVQEAFVRAFQQWERYDPERPLRPWLHAIASRVALDRLRRRRVRTLAIPRLWRDGDIETQARSYGADPAGRVVLRAEVTEALATLDPIPRAALLLRHRYGYDYEEIGALLGLSATNVGAVLTRARTVLRRLLDEETRAQQKEQRA